MKVVEFDLAGKRQVGEVIRENKHTIIVRYRCAGKTAEIKRHRVKLYRTDLHGDVEVITDGEVVEHCEVSDPLAWIEAYAMLSGAMIEGTARRMRA